ncbi:MAG TPA: hypothetical protein VFU02_16180 [Polyangiaceae bacterium]|nr:hypothetical protein [Polyangiaceae bacterium]
MSTLRALRESLVQIARRHSRRADEIEDVAHDLVLAALKRGLPLDGETFLRSVHAAARRHSAFLARSAGRRRAREASSAVGDLGCGALASADDPAGADEGAPLSVLSPALRTTLLLLLQGFDKAELRAALGLSDAALRKRFQSLREHGPLLRPHLPSPERSLAPAGLRRSQIALLPRLVAAGPEARFRRILATSDPDGHGLIFIQTLTPGRSAATTQAPAARERALAKGNPCSTASSRTSPSSS